MKIVGSTTSEKECNEIEQIIKTFLIGQRARNLANTTHHQPKKQHSTPLLPPDRLTPPQTPKIHHFTVKGLT